ncbi:hypothetical protein D3OALGB2SA_590, partial [Olavius algarvensis associated proteobacterium Delta 3]
MPQPGLGLLFDSMPFGQFQNPISRSDDLFEPSTSLGSNVCVCLRV